MSTWQLSAISIDERQAFLLAHTKRAAALLPTTVSLSTLRTKHSRCFQFQELWLLSLPLRLVSNTLVSYKPSWHVPLSLDRGVEVCRDTRNLRDMANIAAGTAPKSSVRTSQTSNRWRARRSQIVWSSNINGMSNQAPTYEQCWLMTQTSSHTAMET